MSIETPLHTIRATSPLAGDGNNIQAVNLAVLLAQMGGAWCWWIPTCAAHV